MARTNETEQLVQQVQSDQPRVKSVSVYDKEKKPILAQLRNVKYLKDYKALMQHYKNDWCREGEK